jgi:hypothetical protein
MYPTHFMAHIPFLALRAGYMRRAHYLTNYAPR